jgi:hypothetical protein
MKERLKKYPMDELFSRTYKKCRMQKCNCKKSVVHLLVISDEVE